MNRPIIAYLLGGILIVLALLPQSARAGLPLPGGGTNLPAYTPLDCFSFTDTTNWTSALGYAPVSFTNLASSDLGDGPALVVDDPGTNAFLEFPITNWDGTTNLTLGLGSIYLWYAPAWSSTNQGGGGPGQVASLLAVGAYSSNSSAGWWSLYIDPTGSTLNFAAQTNDGSGNCFTYVSAPISWSTNYWHAIYFTYSVTNTALYVDGDLADAGPPITNYPGGGALAGGFYIGSSEGGTNEAMGMLDDLYTYSVPVDPVTIWGDYYQDSFYFAANPLNAAEDRFGTNYPTYTGANYNAVSGVGNLTLVGAGACAAGPNVWFTNFTAWAVGSGTNLTRTVQFTITGGESGLLYDVFANSVLSLDPVTVPWAWIGQGYTCNSYQISGLPNTTCFLMLGTPQDTSGFGLTDAYEELVMEVNPDGPQTDSYGVPYAWYAEQGLNPYTAGMGVQDPDQDGILNYQEYFYGTRPLVSEGNAIWVSTPNGTSSIP